MKLQHFFSDAPFGTHYVMGKEHTVFLQSGEESQILAFSVSCSIRHALC